MTSERPDSRFGYVLLAGTTDHGYTEVDNVGKNDTTFEAVFESAQHDFVDEWSVMSGGTTRAQYLPPTNEAYFAFSLEELLTVATSDTQVEG